MGFDRPFTYHEMGGYLPVGTPLCDEYCHFTFASRQPAEDVFGSL